jgi:hypothetical protein
MKKFAKHWLGPIVIGMALMTTISYFNASSELLPPNEPSRPIASTTELSEARYQQLKPQVNAAFRLSSEPDWTALPNLFTAGTPPEAFFVHEVVNYRSLEGETQIVYAGLGYSGFRSGDESRRIHIGKSNRPVTLVLLGTQLKEWQVDVDPEAKVERIYVISEGHPNPRDHREQKEIAVKVRDGVRVVRTSMVGHLQFQGSFFQDSPNVSKRIERMVGIPVVSAQALPQNGTAEVPFYKDYQSMVDIPKALIRFRAERELKTTKLSGALISIPPVVVGSSTEKIPFFPSEAISGGWNTPIYVRTVGKYFGVNHDPTGQVSLVSVDPDTREVKPLPLSFHPKYLNIEGFNGLRDELILRDLNEVTHETVFFGYNVKTGGEHSYGPRPGLQHVCFQEQLGRSFGVENVRLLVEYDADLNPIKKIPLHNSLQTTGIFNVSELFSIGDQFFVRGIEYPVAGQIGFHFPNSGTLQLLIDPQSGLVQELAESLVRNVQRPLSERKPSGRAGP